MDTVKLVVYVDDKPLLCRVMSRRIKVWFPEAAVHPFTCAKDAEDFAELIDEPFVLITDGNLGGAPGVQETGVMVIEAVRAVLDRRGRSGLLVQEIFFSGRMGDFRTDIERLSQPQAIQAVEKPNYEALHPLLARWLSPVRHLIYMESGDLWRNCMEMLVASFHVQLYAVRWFAEMLQALAALPHGERFVLVTSGLIKGPGLRWETGPEVIEKLRRELAQSNEQARLVGAVILSSDDDLAADARRLTLPEQPVEFVSREMAYPALEQRLEHWLQPRR